MLYASFYVQILFISVMVNFCYNFWERAVHLVNRMVFFMICLFAILIISHFCFEGRIYVLIEPRSEKTRSSGFSTRPDTNRAVQSLKMARVVRFRISIEEGLYYPCSENKGADKLRGYREADLRLCFRIYKNPVFSRRGSIVPVLSLLLINF